MGKPDIPADDFGNRKGWLGIYYPNQKQGYLHELYTEQPFSKYQAWIDLNFMASVEGEIHISYGALMKRWGWKSKNKTHLFIQNLIHHKLLTGTVNDGHTVLKTCGFGVHQKKSSERCGTDSGTARSQKTQEVEPFRWTDEGTQEDIYKEERENAQKKRAFPEEENEPAGVNSQSEMQPEDDDDDGWLTPDEACEWLLKMEQERKKNGTV